MRAGACPGAAYAATWLSDASYAVTVHVGWFGPNAVTYTRCVPSGHVIAVMSALVPMGTLTGGCVGALKAYASSDVAVTTTIFVPSTAACKMCDDGGA